METAYAQLWEEHRLHTNEANTHQLHQQGELWRELRAAAEQHGLEAATVNSLGQALERERSAGNQLETSSRTVASTL